MRRFRMKKNNYVDNVAFLNEVEDCFTHISLLKKINEFSTEEFYVFYIEVEADEEKESEEESEEEEESTC